MLEVYRLAAGSPRPLGTVAKVRPEGGDARELPARHRRPNTAQRPQTGRPRRPGDSSTPPCRARSAGRGNGAGGQRRGGTSALPSTASSGDSATFSHAACPRVRWRHPHRLVPTSRPPPPRSLLSESTSIAPMCHYRDARDVSGPVRRLDLVVSVGHERLGPPPWTSTTP